MHRHAYILIDLHIMQYISLCMPILLIYIYIYVYIPLTHRQRERERETGIYDRALEMICLKEILWRIAYRVSSEYPELSRYCTSVRDI